MGELELQVGPAEHPRSHPGAFEGAQGVLEKPAGQDVGAVALPGAQVSRLPTADGIRPGLHFGTGEGRRDGDAELRILRGRRYRDAGAAEGGAARAPVERWDVVICHKARPKAGTGIVRVPEEGDGDAEVVRGRECLGHVDRVGCRTPVGHRIRELAHELEHLTRSTPIEEEFGRGQWRPLLGEQRREGAEGVDGLVRPEHPSAAGQIENVRPVWRDSVDEVRAERGDLGGCIDTECPLVTAITVRLMRTADAFALEVDEQWRAEVLVEGKDSAGLDRVRHVRMIDDHEVELAGEISDMLVTEGEQRSRLPVHGDTVPFEQQGIGCPEPSHPAWVIPGHAAQHHGRGGR